MKTLKVGKKKRQQPSGPAGKRPLKAPLKDENRREEIEGRRISEEEAEELAWMPYYRSSKASDEEG